MTDKITIKVEVELEIDPAAYYRTYGTAADQLVDDVQDYAVELFGQCAAANEGCWQLIRARGRRGRARRPALAGVPR